MTRLLVSVRDAAEARIALDAGAHLIDVKEPRRGSLGAADSGTIADVIRAVAGRAPVSAALGELLSVDLMLRMRNRHAGHDDYTGLTYAKLGLAGCATVSDWGSQWERAIRALPPGVGSVAVVYADWRAAGAPCPGDVLSEATRLRCRALLIDTFDKASGDLFTHWPIGELASFIAEVREAGLLVVLAGSLSVATISLALRLAPDLIAVRGAACLGSRSGGIDGALVRDLVDLVSTLACC